MAQSRGSVVSLRTPSKKALNTEREAVKVFLRIRPLSSAERANGVEAALEMDKDTPNAVRVRGGKSEPFAFTRVLGEAATQEETFQQTTMPLVQDLLHGKNALLFTYGVTNSGKTYTMQGTAEHGGLLSRSLDIIFNSIGDARAPRFTFAVDSAGEIVAQSPEDARRDRERYMQAGGDLTQDSLTMTRSRNRVRKSYDPTVVPLGVSLVHGRFAVLVSYVELYNDKIFDLLEDPDDKGAREPKRFRENTDTGRAFISNLTEREVHSTEEAFLLLEKGQRARQVAANGVNASSSRGHAIFTIRVVQALMVDGEMPSGSHIHCSQFSLVDLAGSERSDRTGSKGVRQREAGEINKSLTILRRCFDILRANRTAAKPQLVPYRESDLTKLFKNFFDGDGKVVMVVCVSPASTDAEETKHVLKFGCLAQTMSTVPSTPAPRMVPREEEPRSVSRRLMQEFSALPEAGAYGDSGKLGTDPLSDYAESHMAMWDARLKSIAEKESRFRQRLVEQGDVMSALQDRVEELESQAAARIAEMEQLVLQLEHERRARQAMSEEQAQSFREKISELVTAVERRDRQLADAEAAAEEHERELADMHRELLEAQNEAASSRAQLDGNIHARRQLEAQCADMETNALEQQTRAAAQIEDLAVKNAQLAQQVEEVHGIVAQLREDLEHSQREARVAVNDGRSKQTEIDSLRARLAEEQLERARLEREISMHDRAASEELQRREQQLSDRRKSLERHRAEAAREKDKHQRLAETISVLREILDPVASAERGRAANDGDTDHLLLGATTGGPAQQERTPGLTRADMNSARVLNHLSPTSAPSGNTFLQPVLPADTKTVAKPTLRQFLSKDGHVKHDTYVLNHADAPNTHKLFKGEVEPSLSRKGVSVRFTGVETADNAPLTAAPRPAASAAQAAVLAGAAVAKAALKRKPSATATDVPPSKRSSASLAAAPPSAGPAATAAAALDSAGAKRAAAVAAMNAMSAVAQGRTARVASRSSIFSRRK